MAESNPYAPPQVVGPIPASPESTDGGVWRDGDILVMHKQAVLPDRCIKCNSPADGDRLRRKLSWHHPGWFLLVLVSLWIYIIVALCIRHKATIDIGICEQHRARRRNGIIAAWLVALAGIVAIVIGASNNSLAGLIALGAVLILASLIMGLVFSNIVSPKKIDEYYVWLKNVNPEYLAQFPAVPGV